MSTIEHDSGSKEIRKRYCYNIIVSLGKDRVPITLFTNSQDYRDYLTSGVLDQNGGSEITGWQSTYKAILEESVETSITYDEPENIMTISGMPDQITRSLVYILYTFSEAPRQAEGRYTLQAAAVCRKDRGLLILGGKGAGKTALAMSLCLDWGYDLIGNDVVIVGRSPGGDFQIYGGDSVFKPRKLTMEEFPQYKDAFVFDADKNDFEAKAIVDPRELGVFVKDRSVSLVGAVQIFMHADKSTRLQVSQPPHEALRLNMYENASRYIRGVTTPIFDKDGYFLCSLPSFDNSSLSARRVRFLEEIIGSIGVISVAGGNLREISQYVRNQGEG